MPLRPCLVRTVDGLWDLLDARQLDSQRCWSSQEIRPSFYTAALSTDGAQISSSWLSVLWFGAVNRYSSVLLECYLTTAHTCNLHNSGFKSPKILCPLNFPEFRQVGLVYFHSLHRWDNFKVDSTLSLWVDGFRTLLTLDYSLRF